MDSVELYRQLLGLTTPWMVERVELDVSRQQVEGHVGHPTGQRFACPECGCELGVYDHQAERVWRHLDSCQFLTYLHARPPRVSCPEHGVHQVPLPWAQAGSRFTNLFEALAINVLLSQSEPLQDRRLFPLRRPQLIPERRDPHESRMNHK